VDKIYFFDGYPQVSLGKEKLLLSRTPNCAGPWRFMAWDRDKHIWTTQVEWTTTKRFSDGGFQIGSYGFVEQDPLFFVEREGTISTLYRIFATNIMLSI
jgi:hypothetical protein